MSDDVWSRRKRTEVETVQRKALRLVRVDADIEIYFCDPHAPRQRATNENTNGLLRQYFPKGSDLSVHTAADLGAVADELNDRPRKRLRFAKPIEEIGPPGVALTARIRRSRCGHEVSGWPERSRRPLDRLSRQRARRTD